jgi:hypothetical protein
MQLPGFGNLPNSDLLCYNLLGQAINCNALDQNFVAQGVYIVTDTDGNLLNQAFVVQHNEGPDNPGKKAWGFPGKVAHKSIEDNPYLSYLRYVEYAVIGILLFMIFRSILK